MQSIVNFDLSSLMPQDIMPLVSKLHWTRGNHEEEDVYNYYDDDENYYDPYYNNGSNGEWLANVDWELVAVWGIIVFVYVAISTIGMLVFPPLVICLLTTDGDLETCSFGIWNNGYKEPEEKCYNRDWYYELSHSEAQCYLDRYPDLKEAFGDNICDAKIHWETYGMDEGRDANCYE